MRSCQINSLRESGNQGTRRNLASKRTMKILQINKFLYPKGGDAICALTTGDLLRFKGHEVVFWGMKNKKDPAYPHRDIFVDEVNSWGPP